jgi:hypothetical protein
VITQAGPNVMLNLRSRSLLRALLMQPVRFAETALSTLILGSRPHSTAKFNKLHTRLYDLRGVCVMLFYFIMHYQLNIYYTFLFFSIFFS